jgi:hypothetical protein
MPEANSVMNSLMNRLYSELADVSDVGPQKPDDQFIVWCSPGIPMSAEELRFTTRGIVGQGDTPEKKAEDTRQLIEQAAQFARLTDFVPRADGIYDEDNQRALFNNDGLTFSGIYERVLKQSQVAFTPLPEEQKNKLERFRKLLYPERTVVDPVTGEEKQQRFDGPMLQEYRRFMKAYKDELLKYNDARSKAMAAVSTEDVLSFSLNEETLRQSVRSAESDWTTAGQKNEVEQIQAFINQITLRDLTLWKADLLDRLHKGKIADPRGQQFCFTTLVPGNFAQSTQGWAKFHFTEEETEKYSSGKSTQFAANGSGGWGPLKFGGGAESSTTSKKEVSTVSKFKMSFTLTHAAYCRPACEMDFLRSRAWRLSTDAVDVGQLSDGGSPPKGLMVAYPTMILFARDILVDFSELHDESSEVHKQLAAKASGGWGPFKVSGSYQRGSETREVKSKLTENGLSVEGMQIIGFRCSILDLTPNPHESIKEFV